MASGRISLNSSKAWEGEITWSAEAHVDGNYSTLSVVAKMWKTDGYTTSSNSPTSGTITINGTSYSLTGYREFKSSVTIFEKTLPITHNADGKKTVPISLSCKGQPSTSLASATLTGSGNAVLDAIPQSISLTAADSFTDEQNPSISYSNPAGSSATSLTAYILSEDEKTEFVRRSVSKTAGSATLALTDSERNAMRNYIPEASKMNVVFKLVAVFGSTSKTAKLTKEFSVVNAAPTVAPSVMLKNPTAHQEFTGDTETLIRYVSEVDVSMVATALKGASIKTLTIWCGSAYITKASGTFKGAQSGTFSFIAVDSRGNKTTQTVKRNIVEYILPTVNITPNAPDTSGNFTFTVYGNYFNQSFGIKGNTLTVRYRYREGAGEFGQWQDMTPTIDKNSYTAQQIFEDLDYQTTYTFQVMAFDAIGSTPTLEKAVRTIPVFNWGADYFNVNGTFMVNGESVGNPVELYKSENGGETGDVELDEEAGGFESVEIFYCDNNGRGSSSLNVYAPEGKEVCLVCYEPVTGGSCYIRRSSYTISGKKITYKQDGGYFWMNSGGTTTTRTGQYIKILRVVGHVRKVVLS